MPFTCIFCGSTTGASKEHVVSRDTRDVFQFVGNVAMFGANNEDPIKVEQTLVVILGREICESCNNGWLNQLDERVRPFLHQMMLNKAAISLDEVMQRDFARWAVVKALLIERAIRQRSRGARSILGYGGSDAELAWLACHDDPPPRSRVWLGAFDAEGTVALTHVAALCASPAGTPAHVTTVTWGYAIFQVFSTDFVAADSAADENFPLECPSPFNAALSAVWPPRTPAVAWPSTAFVARSDLASVVTWGDRLTPATSVVSAPQQASDTA